MQNLYKCFHPRQTGANPSLFKDYLEMYTDSNESQIRSLHGFYEFICPAIFTRILWLLTATHPSTGSSEVSPEDTHTCFFPKDFAFPWHSLFQTNQFTIQGVFVLAAKENIIFLSVLLPFSLMPNHGLMECNTSCIPGLSSTRGSKEIQLEKV